MTLKSDKIQQVQAWIPEDFNLDIHILGDITGVNMKDTKLISKAVRLITEQGNINVRKLRNDDCIIKT
jgi:hypothetical protein